MKIEKLFQILGILFMISGIIFLLIHSLIVTGSSNEDFARDIFGFPIPHPPIWTSYVPYVGFFLGIIFEFFSIHGLVGIITFTTFISIGGFLLDLSKRYKNSDKIISTIMYNDTQDICFIHHSDHYKEYPVSQSENDLVFYWFTDRYFDQITSGKFSAYKYLYFFMKNFYEDKIKLHFRGDGGLGEACRRYLEFKKWAEIRVNNIKNKSFYTEPPMLYSYRRIDPDLIAEYNEDEKDFFVIFPDKYKGIKLGLYSPNGYSKNFLNTKLPDLFPNISKAIPFKNP